MSRVAVRTLLGDVGYLVGLRDIHRKPGVADEDRRNMPIAQPPRSAGCIDHRDVQCMFRIDVADGKVFCTVGACGGVLRVGGAERSGEVVDGRAVVHALGIGVVGEQRKPFAEVTANRGLQRVVVRVADMVDTGPTRQRRIGLRVLGSLGVVGQGDCIHTGQRDDVVGDVVGEMHGMIADVVDLER